MPNLKQKTLPKQLLKSHPLAFALPEAMHAQRHRPRSSIVYQRPPYTGNNPKESKTG